MKISPQKWLVCYQENKAAKHNLICFPFGGAAASAFRPLANALSDDLQVWCVQLPGRENRYSTPFETNPDVIVRAVAEEIQQLGL